jgi:hypothetical protein
MKTPVKFRLISMPCCGQKLLLAGIAALFLAAGTAHAYPPRYYDCGKAFVKIQTGKGTAPSGRRVFPTTWIIQENWERKMRKACVLSFH